MSLKTDLENAFWSEAYVDKREPDFSFKEGVEYALDFAERYYTNPRPPETAPGNVAILMLLNDDDLRVGRLSEKKIYTAGAMPYLTANKLKKWWPLPKVTEKKMECNNCDWQGGISDTVMLGKVGPLCPGCRETVMELF